MTARPAKQQPPAPDLWSKWFNRSMQVGGFALVAYEAQAKDRAAWLGLIAVAMMLGGGGIRLLVRGAVRFLADDEEIG